MKKTLLWLLLLSATGLAEPAGQEAGPHGRGQALTRALQQHPQLKASQARLRQAEIAAGSAATPGSAPALAWAAGRCGDTPTATTSPRIALDDYLFVQQQLRPPGQTQMRSKIASQELEASQAAARLLELQIRQQVKDAYAARLGPRPAGAVVPEKLAAGPGVAGDHQLCFQAGTSAWMGSTPSSRRTGLRAYPVR